jgi:hypothetical protein
MFLWTCEMFLKKCQLFYLPKIQNDGWIQDGGEKVNNLKLTDVGINANQRIFISENLTKFDQEFFAAAMRLKRDGKLATVSTSKRWSCSEARKKGRQNAHLGIKRVG